MKILCLILVIVFFDATASAPPEQNYSTIKNLTIHKSKRPFVKIQDRKYIKKKAIENNNASQKSVPKFLETGNQKADVQDYKGALADFNKALLFEPKNAEVIYYCGFMKFQMEDYGNALTDYNNAIEVDSQSVELFYCRGNSKFEMNYPKEAIADYDKAIALDSTDAPSYFNRAVSNRNIGNKESSCKDFQMALKYGDVEADALLREYCQ